MLPNETLREAGLIRWPAWPERRLWGQVAGIFWPVACSRIRGVLAGGMRAFWGPCAAWQRWVDVGRLADQREAGRGVGLR